MSLNLEGWSICSSPLSFKATGFILNYSFSFVADNFTNSILSCALLLFTCVQNNYYRQTTTILLTPLAVFSPLDLNQT